MHSKYFPEFNNIIFMGNGGCNCTAANILKLHKLVDKCITEVSGLQQPSHPESPEEAIKNNEYNKEKWTDVMWMVKDIAMALTGEEIVFATHAQKEKENDLKCGEDFSGCGDTYWCGECNECKRFAEEYSLFVQLHKKLISRKK